MTNEIKEILDNLKYCKEHDEENNYYPEDIFSKDDPYILLDYIINLQEENERLNNIINTILDFPFFKEECPLDFGFVEKELESKAQDVFYEDEWCEKNCDDNYKKCWLKYFDKLKELKENK